ncbi:lactonase family protein [Pseudomonas sp. HR96]|uniref:lactonase family protein n=1 Tax=Pseudomonas sp. HR96 TaxID=1027966 RepID=UPI002A753AF4|nr:lactonase family protein [Pseudomonas sp. HR96]WPO98389.1 lactonase family protein [Pseudomonas sp. HR96]
MVSKTCAAAATTFVYVSSTADGLISHYRLDEQTGALTLIDTVVAGEQSSPMAVSPDRSSLYVALRGQAPRSVRFAIEPGTGTLRHVGETPLPGSMAYLSTDRSGQFLFGASYGDDLVSVQAINPDHSVEAEPTCVLKTGMHAHSVRTDNSNRFVYIGELGTDHVLQYRLHDSGDLSAIDGGKIAATASSGPRHLAFSPNGRFLYVLGETDGAVTAYLIDPDTGALSQSAREVGIPETSKLAQGIVRDARNNDGKDDPTPRIWAADIKLSPDGTLLYFSERTSSSVSAFAVDPDSGELTWLGYYPVQEKQPRNIAFSANGRWLLVSGEKSEKFASYDIDPEDGSLTRTGEAPAGRNQVWIEVVRL